MAAAKHGAYQDPKGSPVQMYEYYNMSIVITTPVLWVLDPGLYI